MRGFSIDTYFAPDEDTQQIFIDYIKETKSHLRIAIYGMHLPPLIDALLDLHKKGVDIGLVIDHTQARGTYENPELKQLLAAGIPLMEGSSQHHKIMHHKFVVRDKEITLSGSWNFSLSASDENNYFDVIYSPSRAEKFLSIWQEIWDFMSAKENKYQEG